MGRHLVLASLSVRSSICLSVTLSFPVYIFEPLVGFTNNSAQMSIMANRRAVRMFDKGHSSMLNIEWLYFRSISFQPLVGFTNNSAQMSSMISWCAVIKFNQGRINVKVKGQSLTLNDCITSRLYNSWMVGDILKWLGTKVPWDDVQSACLTKFTSRSRW